MEINRRSLLRLLPLAPLAVISLPAVADWPDALAHEVKSDKRYLIHVRENISSEACVRFSGAIKAQGINATVVRGDFDIYEI